jgi:hypothetical protein
MQVSGNISKMSVTADDHGKVQYMLGFSEQSVDMNSLIGQEIQMSWQQEINCMNCNRKTKKSFSQGYCFPCMQKLARCDTCIIKPELCHYDQGTCREPQWGEANCLKSHFVYLSNTGAIKVGITRFADNTISSRWIDQGATQAVAILRVQNRLISGLAEKAIGQYVGDKTNWRTMLKGQIPEFDLLQKRDELLQLAHEDLEEISEEYGLQAIEYLDLSPVDIQYPVEQYPTKIKSINLDKEPVFSGTLMGIKGQYLMLDGNRVINMRKYSGYNMTLATN